MSKKKIVKRAYCSSCCQNVPHFRRMGGRFQETFGKYLLKFRIGPWFCYHCRRRKLILPTVWDEAPNYKFSRSKSRDDAEMQKFWSVAGAGKADPSEEDVAGSDFEEGNFEEGQDHFNSPDESVVMGGESLNGVQMPSHESQEQSEIDVRSEVSYAGDEQSVYYVDVSSSHSITLEESAGGRSAVSERNGHSESDEILEAEPVGNFIKDESLVLKSTRIQRFTEKYRDAVVARILAGKVSVSALTKDGEYSEAELLSWIADKAKRQEEKIETLEASSKRSRWIK